MSIVSEKDFEILSNRIKEDTLSVVADATCQMYRTKKNDMGIIVSKDKNNKVLKVIVSGKGLKLFENEYTEKLAKICEQRIKAVKQNIK